MTKRVNNQQQEVISMSSNCKLEFKCDSCNEYRGCNSYKEGYTAGYSDYIDRAKYNGHDVFHPYTRGYHDGSHIRLMEKRRDETVAHLRRTLGTAHLRIR